MLARGEVPTRGGAEQLYAALVALCQEQIEAAGAPVAGVGVGCAGPMRYPDGIVSPINVIAWQEFPLGGRLRETFVAVHAWDLLEPPLQAELGRAARLDFSRQVRVRQAMLGPDAGLLGAAASALRSSR
jgi:hypothetical protein